MKTYESTPLCEDDVRPFTHYGDTFVWVYKKEQCFVGLLSSITVEPECKLRVAPIIKFIPNNANPDDVEVGSRLIDTKENIVEFFEKAPPFTLNNPERQICEAENSAILAIRFGDGMAILSKRDEDISIINEFISLARAQSKT